MKRIFLMAVAGIITFSAFADGNNKKQDCKKCDKHCTQQCAQKCGSSCCDKATVKKN
jgi:hypothetical protein